MVKKFLLTLAAVLLLGAGGMLGFFAAVYAPSAGEQVGSVAQSNEYNSTTTVANTAANTYNLKSGTSVLGSVVITSSSASAFTIYDSLPSSTTTPTTTIAVFEANAAEGTYTFDINVYSGISIGIPSGYSGSANITFR